MKYYALEGFVNTYDLTESKKAYKLESEKYINVQQAIHQVKCFLPVSVCKVVDSKIYVPAWIVASNNIWNYIEKYDTLEFEEKKTKSTLTTKEKVNGKLDKLLKNETIYNCICLYSTKAFDFQRNIRCEKWFNEELEDNCLLGYYNKVTKEFNFRKEVETTTKLNKDYVRYFVEYIEERF